MVGSRKDTSKIESRHRDLPPELFRKCAYQAVDWIADYLENMSGYPVLSRTRPGEIKSCIPKSPPEQPEPFEDVVKDFQKVILPGITHWNHPRFFAYFSITGSYPGVIGEMLSSALNVNAMLWKTSPSATELEEVVLDWLRQMVGLPQQFEGVINDTASAGSLCAMAAAREAIGLQVREKGLAGRSSLPRLRAYCSEEAHSSIEKAAIVLCLGQDGIRKIPTDEVFRMDIHALETAVKSDLDGGIRPVCVIATIGTTSTTSVDPVNEIAQLCKKYGIWLHVDAAYGGAAAILPEMRTHFVGWDNADSIIINPHKWLFTPIDCSVLYCRRPETLKQAFSLTPEYLRTAEAGEAKNLMDYGISLGRRFRALKLWMVIRSLGRQGIANAIREHIAYAHRLAERIETHPDFQLLAPVPFSTLVFRLCPKNKSGSDSEINGLNEKLLEEVNKTGQVFLSHTKLRGKFGIRLAIGNLKTTWEDVSLAWDVLQQKAAELTKP
ncbi:MAG: aminotransferase class V-fold PLP-dependent enzyme [Candidatus Bathyarchaeia archaeon]